MPAAIEATGLTRRFGPLVAVDGVDLSIPEASIYGFLGPNGSGKSTTIRMLCGLLRPSAGEVSVLGHRMPQQAEALRRRIGYMTQSFSLYQDLTVRENLQFLAGIYTMPRASRDARIEEQLRLYRLDDQARQRAGTLSGGQKQRLALAAATLHQPDLLLLDEPTSAVDPQSRRDFWETLFELVDTGITILVSTHYMDEAERCHRVAILDGGRLMAEGSPRQLMDAVPAQVIVVDAEDPRAARRVLREERCVRSIAQLGARLRILLDPETRDGVHRVRSRLQQASVGADVHAGRASLEDVFVAATGFRERRE